MNALHVEFYQQAVLLGGESEKAKRPVYATEDYVRFSLPGGKNVVERSVREEDKIEYSKLWEQYKAKREQVGDGLPVDQWLELDPGRALTLKAAKIHTVEQIAALSDSQAAEVLGLGAYELREKAKRAITKEDPSIALKAENERLRADFEVAQTQLKELQTMMAELKASEAERRQKK